MKVAALLTSEFSLEDAFLFILLCLIFFLVISYAFTVNLEPN